MNTRFSLRHIFLLNIFLVSFLSIGCVGYLWISFEYKEFNRESDQIRKTYISERKNRIKNEVDRVIDYIQYRRNLTTDKLKADIRSRVDDAVSAALNIHTLFQKEKSTGEIAGIIREMLRPLRFNEGRGYYFVYDMEGNNVLLPFSPELEGQNLWDLQDSKGLFTIRRFIRMMEKEREGFIKWHWYKPGDREEMSEKIGYAKYLEPLDWWIGTGEYVTDFEKDLQREMLEWINKIRFGREGYIFVYSFKAITLAHYKSQYIGVDRWNYRDLNGCPVVRELIGLSHRPDGGFLEYVATSKPSTGKQARKIGYARSIPDWEWMIGAGVYLDEIESVLEEKRIALEKRIRGHLTKIIFILFSLLLAGYLISLLISNKIHNNFKRLTSFLEKATYGKFAVEEISFNFVEFRDFADSVNRMVQQRNAALDALKENGERLNLALKSTRQGLWDWDIPSGNLIWDGRVKEIFGYHLSEVKAHVETVKAVTHPEDWPAARQKMAEHLKGETEYYASVYRVKTKSGTWKWIHDQGKVIRRTEDGSALRAVGIYMDITRQKRAEAEKEALREKLNRSRKMESLGLLAGGVAHDLNNVLSGIVSYPDLMLFDLPEDSPLRSTVTAIKTSGQKAAAIVQDLLTLARRGVMQYTVLNLNDIVGEYLASPEHSKLLASHPEVDVRTSPERNLLNIKGSPIHLKKTVMNLVGNAAEAQPDGGVIFISTENRYVDKSIQGFETIDEGDYALLRIEDKGIGIAAKDLKRIFEPFYTKKVMGRSGTGLGMAVVWGTVQDHKGRINVESTEDKGSVFELYFRATRDVPEDKERSASMWSYTGNGETILVVDDVIQQREIAGQILTKLNYRVHVVPSGEAAIQYLSGHSADLVLLDMIMTPGMDGLDTYRKILNISPNQKAIIASGFAETDRVRTAREMGAGQYLKKPYTIENLALAIKKELASGSLNRKPSNDQ